MSKIKNDNYITIQGFMVNDLKLKGNELLIYAIIYGFSQKENQIFTGCLGYLAEWCSISKQTVITTLRSLVNKGLIGKNEKTINNVKFCEYYSKDFNEVVKKFDGGSQKTLMGGSQKTLMGSQKIRPNNKEYNILKNNIDYNKENNIYITENIKEKNDPEIFETIIKYLNDKTGMHYKHTTNKTQSLISARLNEGFTISDFYTVIDKKCNDWLNDPKWSKYLRPETLFGTKFESYLNQPEKEITTNDLPIDFEEGWLDKRD